MAFTEVGDNVEAAASDWVEEILGSSVCFVGDMLVVSKTAAVVGGGLNAGVTLADEAAPPERIKARQL